MSSRKIINTFQISLTTWKFTRTSNCLSSVLTSHKVFKCSRQWYIGQEIIRNKRRKGKLKSINTFEIISSEKNLWTLLICLFRLGFTSHRHSIGNMTTFQLYHYMLYIFQYFKKLNLKKMYYDPKRYFWLKKRLYMTKRNFWNFWWKLDFFYFLLWTFLIKYSIIISLSLLQNVKFRVSLWLDLCNKFFV
jgi:hypothetical protein